MLAANLLNLKASASTKGKGNPAKGNTIQLTSYQRAFLNEAVGLAEAMGKDLWSLPPDEQRKFKRAGQLIASASSTKVQNQLRNKYLRIAQKERADAQARKTGVPMLDKVLGTPPIETGTKWRLPLPALPMTVKQQPDPLVGDDLLSIVIRDDERVRTKRQYYQRMLSTPGTVEHSHLEVDRQIGRSWRKNPRAKKIVTEFFTARQQGAGLVTPGEVRAAIDAILRNDFRKLRTAILERYADKSGEDPLLVAGLGIRLPDVVNELMTTKDGSGSVPIVDSEMGFGRHGRISLSDALTRIEKRMGEPFLRFLSRHSDWLQEELKRARQRELDRERERQNRPDTPWQNVKQAFSLEPLGMGDYDKTYLQILGEALSDLIPSLQQGMETVQDHGRGFASTVQGDAYGIDPELIYNSKDMVEAAARGMKYGNYALSASLVALMLANPMIGKALAAMDVAGIGLTGAGALLSGEKGKEEARRRLLEYYDAYNPTNKKGLAQALAVINLVSLGVETGAKTKRVARSLKRQGVRKTILDAVSGHLFKSGVIPEAEGHTVLGLTPDAGRAGTSGGFTRSAPGSKTRNAGDLTQAHETVLKLLQIAPAVKRGKLSPSEKTLIRELADDLRLEETDIADLASEARALWRHYRSDAVPTRELASGRLPPTRGKLSPVRAKTLTTDLEKVEALREFSRFYDHFDNPHNYGIIERIAAGKQLIRSTPVWDVVSLARAGQAQRRWYSGTFDEFQRRYGLSKKRLFASITAALSANRDPRQNIHDALQVMVYVADSGLPLGNELLEHVFGRIEKEYRGIWGGDVRYVATRKRNLSGVLAGEGLSPSALKLSDFQRAASGDPNATAMDRWGARLLGMRESDMKGLTYAVARAKMRAAAKELGWPPAETQAASWSFVRALDSKIGTGLSIREALSSLTLNDLASVPSLRTTLVHDLRARALLARLDESLHIEGDSRPAAGRRTVSSHLQRPLLTASEVDELEQIIANLPHFRSKYEQRAG